MTADESTCLISLLRTMNLKSRSSNSLHSSTDVKGGWGETFWVVHSIDYSLITSAGSGGVLATII